MSGRRRAAIAVLLVFAGGLVTGQAVQRIFPADGDAWGLPEWEQMTPSERYFYVHGHIAGAYVTYQVVAQEYDAGRTLNTAMDELLPVRRYIQSGGGASLDRTNDYYRMGGTAPMMMAPILNTPQGGRSNL